jgi:hypothetical protein
MKIVLKEIQDFELLESFRGIAAVFVSMTHCRALCGLGYFFFRGSEFVKMFPRDQLELWDYCQDLVLAGYRLSVECCDCYFCAIQFFHRSLVGPLIILLSNFTCAG